MVVPEQVTVVPLGGVTGPVEAVGLQAASASGDGQMVRPAAPLTAARSSTRVLSPSQLIDNG